MLSIWDLGLSRPVLLAILSPQFCLPSPWTHQSSGKGCSLAVAWAWLFSLSSLSQFQPGKARREKGTLRVACKRLFIIPGNGNLNGHFFKIRNLQNNAVAAAAAAAKLHQSCPTLCDPIDGSPPGSPVPGILQARTLEWVANAGK